MHCDNDSNDGENVQTAGTWTRQQELSHDIRTRTLSFTHVDDSHESKAFIGVSQDTELYWL